LAWLFIRQPPFPLFRSAERTLYPFQGHDTICGVDNSKAKEEKNNQITRNNDQTLTKNQETVTYLVIVSWFELRFSGIKLSPSS
jgi:hypothetical protein